MFRIGGGEGRPGGGTKDRQDHDHVEPWRGEQGVAGEVVSAVSSGTEQVRPGRRSRVSNDELVRRRGARPIDHPSDMARDVFASDEELDEFLAFVRESRHANMA